MPEYFTRSKIMKNLDNAGTALMGTIVTLPIPHVAEIMAEAGFDWILIDMEHSSLSLADVHALLAAAGEKMLKIVRVPGNDEVWIKRILDMGCDGILVPMINSGEAAACAVASALYPPDGRRSVGVGRAHGYGRRFGEYVARANRDLVIMLQVEHIEAVMNIDSILATTGVSGIFIGPYDLSASMGLAGQVTHPDVVAAIKKVKDKCREAGIPWGIFSMSLAGMEEHISDGCRYALCGIDVNMLSSEAGRISDMLKADGRELRAESWELRAEI
jgi:2-dehydro-3-deoxyglucarate aldolase/4-hydroxy-2-oxoheptanedioate aldolase